jgi:predicted site-specific integrase-resolvase
MNLSAREAAEAVGLSRDGILKAIRTGKLSAQKNQNGEWRIEPVELFRVYTAVSANGHSPVAVSPQTSEDASVESLQAELRQFQQRLADKDDVIEDLRQRLDAEADERRKLTLILTETRSIVPPAPVPQRRSWWQRVWGR